MEDAATHLESLGYRPDVETADMTPGPHPSLESMVWEDGLVLMATPLHSTMFSLYVDDATCPDSLKASADDCTLHNAILVALVRADTTKDGVLVLVPQTVVGPAKGPLRPWPLTKGARQTAALIARAHYGRVLSPAELQIETH
jgi:hypothetical protein